MNPGLQLDREAFLARYWQREPLLIKAALPDFEAPISANELAGLALEEEVESRIIELADGQWRQHHGPFVAEDFTRDSAWTLLVQAVDQLIPEVAELRQLVDFIPQWRIDDVMVSYAVDGGSVGPHYDNYDVFLLQGEGQRLWQLGDHCDGDSALLPHPDLRILEHFESRTEYLLEPGDILYVPPGLAHWGIARGECTTFSIGFRAPRVNDMLSHWLDSLLERVDSEQFYRDEGAAEAFHPGQIRPEDLQRARDQLRKLLDADQDARWFGELVTEPRYPWAPDADELEALKRAMGEVPCRVQLSPGAKLAWDFSAEGIMVYANGFAEPTGIGQQALLQSLSLGQSLTLAEPAGAEQKALLTFLAETGALDVE